MVKIKILKAAYEDEEPFVGKVVDALKTRDTTYTDKDYFYYHINIGEAYLRIIAPDNCEEIVEEPTEEITECSVKKTKSVPNRILLVEKHSLETDIDDLDKWCTANDIKLIVYKANSTKPQFLDC